MATRLKDKVQVIPLGLAFEEYLTLRDLKPNTKRDYRKVVQHGLADWLEIPLHQITHAMIEERFHHMSTSGKRSPGRAQANKAMRVLKAVMNFAECRYEGALLPRINPVKGLKFNKQPRRTGYISPQELEKWFGAVLACDTAQFKDYLLLLIFTGLRKEEAATLKWSEVDFEKRTILIKETKNREPLKLPMTPIIQEILERRRQSAKINNEHVFIGRYEGTQLKRFDKTFTKVQAAFGRTFLLHDLRRTFVTVAEAVELPIYTIKQLINHRSGSDPTFGYVISNVERLRQPLSLVNDYILKNAKISQ